MAQQDRRNAMVALSALWLAACGNGGDSGSVTGSAP